MREAVKAFMDKWQSDASVTELDEAILAILAEAERVDADYQRAREAWTGRYNAYTAEWNTVLDAYFNPSGEAAESRQNDGIGVGIVRIPADQWRELVALLTAEPFKINNRERRAAMSKCNDCGAPLNGWIHQEGPCLRRQLAAMTARAEAAEAALGCVRKWANENLDENCTCSVEYKSRGRRDPLCQYCGIDADVLWLALGKPPKAESKGK